MEARILQSDRADNSIALIVGILPCFNTRFSGPGLGMESDWDSRRSAGTLPTNWPDGHRLMMALPPRQDHKHPSGNYGRGFLCPRDINVDADSLKVRGNRPDPIGDPNIPYGSIDGSGLKYRS
jgi:hypothetical protein